jgi:hypothetical protein
MPQNLSDLKNQTADARRPREVTVPCSVMGCPNDTKGRKPYCIAHLDHLPYVKQLKAELARHADLLDHLAANGPATIGRLARVSCVSIAELEPSVADLERAGVVETETVAARHGHTITIVKLAA